MKETFEKIKLEVENSFDTDFWQNPLKDFIKEIRSAKNTQKNTDFIQEILVYWANLIGCADDGELAENNIDNLYQNGFISEAEQHYFWENVHFRQGDF